jgi:uncharacterized protein HemY
VSAFSRTECPKSQEYATLLWIAFLILAGYFVGHIILSPVNKDLEKKKSTSTIVHTSRTLVGCLTIIAVIIFLLVIGWLMGVT